MIREGEYYVHEPENWDHERCVKESKRYHRDGCGTKMHRPGYIGQHYGKIRYNGGCIREDDWWEGEIIPLPIVSPGFVIIHVRTWGYFIEVEK